MHKPLLHDGEHLVVVGAEDCLGELEGSVEDGGCARQVDAEAVCNRLQPPPSAPCFPRKQTEWVLSQKKPACAPCKSPRRPGRECRYR